MRSAPHQVCSHSACGFSFKDEVNSNSTRANNIEIGKTSGACLAGWAKLFDSCHRRGSAVTQLTADTCRFIVTNNGWQSSDGLPLLLIATFVPHRAPVLLSVELLILNYMGAKFPEGESRAPEATVHEKAGDGFRS